MHRGQIFLALCKTAIFTALVPFTVAWWLPQRIHHAFDPPKNASSGNLALGIPSGALFLLGAAMYLWCAWDFSVHGLGTPAPIDAPRTLVVSGPYRFVRNPMYLGVFCIVASRVLYFASLPVLVYFFAAASCAILFVHFYEEPHLHRVFGDQYADYCRRVRGWLPRIPRHISF
jgi:protein-S-isoprenylcysteine O-methyltransferase Ste14